MTSALFFTGVCMNGCAFGNTASWKEEVLLHDGQKIIIKRSQTYGGRHEIGQSPPVREHTISFSMLDSGNAIRWTSDYSEDIGRTNFNLLALHIINGTPYLVVEPNLCLSYNKSGRPNPPYVFFKHDGTTWKRIPLAELPAEFTSINLIVNNSRLNDIKRLADLTGYVPAEGVRQLNSSLRQKHYLAIVRMPLKLGSMGISCPELVYYKGAWVSPGNSIGRRMKDSKSR
jgi:hypothetical protein